MSPLDTDEPWDLVDEAWELHDDGQAEQALRVLAGADANDVRRHATESEIRTTLGDIPGAEAALARAEALGGADEPAVLWAKGELCLDTWRLPEARLAFELLQRIEGGPRVLERLAMLADLTGRQADADRYMAEARALGSESAPPRLSHREFDDAVSDAAQLLPERFQAVLEDFAVVVDSVPPPAFPSGPHLLGVFTGRSLWNADSMAAGELPATIRLFQRNLERVCRNRGELIEQIRITLYHELGHALGFDEHGVHEMGLG